MRTSSKGEREFASGDGTEGGARATPRWLLLTCGVVALAATALATVEVGGETWRPPEVAAAHPGLPAPRANAVVELGRRLFFDPGASHSKGIACASCHRPERGYSDERPVSLDDFGFTNRHSQSLLNLASTGAFHWDGEFGSVEELVSARTGDTRTESGGYPGPGQPDGARLRKVTPVADVLAEHGLYGSAFQAAFGDPKPTRARLSVAVAEYVRTLKSAPSAYDRWVAGDSTALTRAAVEGLDLFRGRAGCTQCHVLEGAAPTFTDGKFHNTGLAKRRSVRPRQSPMGVGDEGRKLVSKQEDDARAFKTPSLRDVALRAPYAHDGSFATLAQVVRYYAVECGKVADDKLDAKIKPFDDGRASAEVDRDVTALVAFLMSLTGETRAGLAETAWNERAERIRLRLTDRGVPYRGPVAVEPAGDVLPGGTSLSAVPIYLKPDAEGWVEVRPFATTHVRVSLPGTDLRPASGELVPDTCAEATLALEAAPQQQRTMFVSGNRVGVR